MSAVANVTPIIATVKNAGVKEKTLKETDAVPKASILDFCEEHYENILPIIIDRARHDKRKEVQTRLNFGESPKKIRRERENSLNSRAGNSPIRFHHERSRTHGWERHDDRNVAKRRKPADEEDLAVPWTCEDVDPFTPRIRNFKSSRKTRMPNNVKTYDGIGDLKHHLKIFQAAAQLPPESIDGYKGLKTAFLAYFMQQKKRMNGAPEYMRISGFMHVINNPELTKRLNEHVPKTVEEMMTATTAFIRGETAAASKKKVHTPWKPHDQSKRHTSERRSDFRNHPKMGGGPTSLLP
ncbi:hypothetical protein Tco_0945399 [Tanacetum coccineum]